MCYALYNRYSNINLINKTHDVLYGNQLLKYLNDKNISDIQLTKREYSEMINSKTAQYNCRKRITNPETLELLREFERNPYTPTGKELMYNLYQSIGMDVDYDEIFAVDLE